MTRQKILDCYKKGEWLLYVAVLFQIVNLLIITIKHVESGMGVFKTRYLGLVCAYVLLGYTILELLTFAVQVIVYVKNKSFKEYFKQNWWKILLRVVFLILALVFVTYGIIRYYTDRINFNMDYDTTDLVFVLALLFASLYGLAKHIKVRLLDIAAAAFMFVLIITFMIVAKVTLSNLLWSFKCNVYMLACACLILFVNVSLASAKVNTYILFLLNFVGLVAMLGCGIIGGVKGFTQLDLFYTARLCILSSGILGLCLVASLLYKILTEISKENFKQKFSSIVIYMGAVAVLLAAVFHAAEIEVSTPLQMHLLDTSFMLTASGLAIGFVGAMFRNGLNIVEGLFAGCTSIFTVVLLCLLSRNSKLAAFPPFYKTSIILSIGFLVVAVCYVVYHFAYKVYKMTRKTEKTQDAVKL